LQNADQIYVSLYPYVVEGRTIHFGSATDITVELAEGVDDWDDMNEDVVPWTGTGTYYICMQVHFSDREKRSAYLYTTDGVTQVPVTDDNLWEPDNNAERTTNAAEIDIKDAITTLDFAKFVYMGKDPNAG